MSEHATDEVLIRTALRALPSAGAAIEQVARQPYAYQTSHRLDELTVILEDGTRCSVLMKDLSRHAMPPHVAHVKPAFLSDPRREILVYESLLPAVSPDAAACYGSVIDPVTGRYWLFLERVAALELYQIGAVEIWQRVAERVGRIHLRLAAVPAAVVDAVPLLICDDRYYRRWLDRAIAFTTPTDTARFAVLQKLVSRFDRVWAAAAASNLPIIHGELYASNVLVDVESDRVALIDWEMAARGPALIDVAALISGWPEGPRRDIALAYREGRKHSLAWSDFQQSLKACELLIALQWLGWAEQWSPPMEHRRDWCAEIASAVERF